MIIGILQRATQSKERTERAEIIETAQMDILGKQTENSGNITEEELKGILLKYGNLSEDEENILDKTLTTTKGNYDISVSEIYNGELKPPKAGLYNAETDELIYSWDKLLELGNMINVNNGALSRSAFTVPNDIAKVRLVVTDNGSVTSITGLQAISKLKEIVIPSTVTSISNSAFGGNQDLISVKMSSGGSGLTIGNGAFGGCGNLTNVELLGNVSSIGNSAFGGCSSLTNVKISNGATTIGDSAFSGCTNIINVELSENTNTIGQNAFGGCSNLIDFTIPRSVTTIGQGAFGGCSSLTSLVIPESVTSLGGGALNGCNGLTNLSVLGNIADFTGIAVTTYVPNTGDTSDLRNNSNLKSITLGSNNVDKGLTAIPNGALRHFKYVENITINRSVTKIGDSAFYGCGMQSITIPDSVTEIGESICNSCRNLTSASISRNIQAISKWAFNTTGLVEITIPEKVTNIGVAAFGNCNSLERVTIRNGSNSLKIESGGFVNTALTDVFYAGTSSNWNGYLDIDNTDNGNQKILNATKHWNS